MEEERVLSGLTITYTISQKKEVSQIKDFIKKHSFLFADFSNGNINEKTSVDDFNIMVENMIREFVKNEEFVKTLESVDFYPSMYVSYLILKKGKSDDTIVQLPSNISIEMVLFLLSIKYYNFDITKICNALFSNDYKEMIENLKNNQRENIYNYYLKCATNYLEDCDSTMLENLESIIGKLIDNAFKYAKQVNSENSKLSDLKQLSSEELDRLTLSFLKYIKAPNEFFSFYNYIKQEKLIYFEYNTELENGYCYYDESCNKWKIKIISDGTLKTFITFIHEFAHYISLTQNDNINFSLLEFPPIYFEKIAGKFLIDIGYPKEIVDELLEFRKTSNFQLFGAQLSQLSHILKFKKNGPYSIKKRIEFNENQIKWGIDFIETWKKIFESEGRDMPDFLLEQIEFSKKCQEEGAENITYKEIDEQIDSFVESGLLVLDGYQYLVGSILADNILENSQRNEETSTMIEVMNNLGRHSINTINDIFGLRLQEKSAKAKELCHQKKLT